MSFIHDIIKIKYSQLGYLPNYPYHLISDREMFDAFININGTVDIKDRFFDDWYPNPFEGIDYNINSNSDEFISGSIEYNKLKDYIILSINNYIKDSIQGLTTTLPDWVYSYMLGEVVYNNSDYLDIEDTLKLLQCSNLDNVFTQQACVRCYAKSRQYISVITNSTRPATIFGEPHVIKQLRLEN